MQTISQNHNQGAAATKAGSNTELENKDRASQKEGSTIAKQTSPRLLFSCLNPKRESPEVNSLDSSVSSQSVHPKGTYNSSLDEAVARNSHRLHPGVKDLVQEAKQALKQDANKLGSPITVNTNLKSNGNLIPQKPSEIINAIHETNLGIPSPEKKQRALAASKDLKVELEISELKLQNLAKRIEDCLISTKNALKLSQKIKEINTASKSPPKTKKVNTSNSKTPTPKRDRSASQGKKEVSPQKKQDSKASPNKKIEEIAEWIKIHASLDNLPKASRTSPIKIENQREVKTPQKNRATSNENSIKKAHKRTASQPFQAKEQVALDPVPQRPNISSILQSSKGIDTKSPGREGIMENRKTSDVQVMEINQHDGEEKAKKSSKPLTKSNPLKKSAAPEKAARDENISTVKQRLNNAAPKNEVVSDRPNLTPANGITQKRASIPLTSSQHFLPSDPLAALPNNTKSEENFTMKSEKSAKPVKSKPVMKRYNLKKKEPQVQKEVEVVQGPMNYQFDSELGLESTKRSGKRANPDEAVKADSQPPLKYTDGLMNNFTAAIQEDLKYARTEMTPTKFEDPVIPDQNLRMQTSPGQASKTHESLMRIFDSKTRIKTENESSKEKKSVKPAAKNLKSTKQLEKSPEIKKIAKPIKTKDERDAIDPQKIWKSQENNLNPKSATSLTNLKDSESRPTPKSPSNTAGKIPPGYQSTQNFRTSNRTSDDGKDLRSSQRNFETAKPTAQSNTDIKNQPSSKSDISKKSNPKSDNTKQNNQKKATPKKTPEPRPSDIPKTTEPTFSTRIDDDSDKRISNQANINEANNAKYKNNVEYLKWLRRNIKDNYENISEGMDIFQNAKSEKIPTNQREIKTPTKNRNENDNPKVAGEPLKASPVPEKPEKNPNEPEKRKRTPPKKITKMPFMNDIAASKYVASLIDKLKNTNKILE